MSFKEKLLEEWESTQELLSDMDPYKDKDAYTGPACTGKTTIHTILFALGYPFVFESNTGMSTIECNNKLSDNPEERKPLPEILLELGIYEKWLEMNLSI